MKNDLAILLSVANWIWFEKFIGKNDFWLTIKNDSLQKELFREPTILEEGEETKVLLYGKEWIDETEMIFKWINNLYKIWSLYV